MSYKEILKLETMLKQAEIPYEIRELHGGYNVCYPSIKFRICSAVEHDFSYGGSCDKIEIMGLLTQGEQEADVGGKHAVCGYMSAEEVFERIKDFHKTFVLA